MEAEELFEAGSPLAERVRARGGDPVAAAWAALPELTDAEKVATLNAHPRIGETRNLSVRSRREQGDQEDRSVMAELRRLNEEYERRFGFRFVVFVNRRPRSAILEVLRERIQRPREVELEAGLRAIVEIAQDRSARNGMKHEITYGKHEISFYRAHARPLKVAAIPESGFTGRDNLVLGGVATVDVFGDNFWPAYTEGDNRMVVATDTMKNFVYAQALEYDGATVEGLAGFLARRFVETYPHLQRVRVRVDEVPFESHSDRLASWDGGSDRGMAACEWDERGLAAFEAGRIGMRLLKLTGSAFAEFQRDRYTTLPEVSDRPLHVFLNCRWRYADPSAVVTGGGEGLVPSEQVRDLLIHTFNDFVSMSIQHLVHEMGQRLLARFGQLAEVSFEAQNRLWDISATSERDPQVRVFSNPKPAHGHITLRLARD